MQLRLFSQKSKKSGIPSAIFGWKNNEKPRVYHGFLWFLDVSRRFFLQASVGDDWRLILDDSFEEDL